MINVYAWIISMCIRMTMYVCLCKHTWASVRARICVCMSERERTHVCEYRIVSYRFYACIRLVYLPFDKHSFFFKKKCIWLFHWMPSRNKTLHKTRENKIKQLIKIKVCECAHLNLYPCKKKEKICALPDIVNVVAIRISCKIPINRKTKMLWNNMRTSISHSFTFYT